MIHAHSWGATFCTSTPEDPINKYDKYEFRRNFSDKIKSVQQEAIL